MNLREGIKARYRLIKAGEHGQPVFLDMTDDHAIEAVRNRFGNRDLLVSACYYTAPDSSAPRIEPLRFHIASAGWEQARTSTVEACYYLNERLSIPPDCLEIACTDIGDITSHGITDGNHADSNNCQTGSIIGRDGSDRRGQDRDIGSHCAGENDKTGKNGGNNRGLANTGRQGDGKGSVYTATSNTVNNPSASDSSKITGTDITGTAAAAEIIITVQPVVFGGQPTPLMPAMNYQLARQMVEAGIENIAQTEGFLKGFWKRVIHLRRAPCA